MIEVATRRTGNTDGLSRLILGLCKKVLTERRVCRFSLLNQVNACQSQSMVFKIITFGEKIEVKKKRTETT